MLKSLLLHIDGQEPSSRQIPAVVDLAARNGARVRGVTIADTRRMAALSTTSESAIYATLVEDRIQRHTELQSTLMTELALECLRAGVNFDVRRLRGDPLQLLPSEARFHDLVVTTFSTAATDDSLAIDGGLTLADLTELTLRGTQPWLVLRNADHQFQRILLVYDGSQPAERAIRSYISQQLTSPDEMRLLALGDSAEAARQHLREMADYVRPFAVDIEHGWVVGGLRQVLVDYLRKWDTDLVILGTSRRNCWSRRFWGGAINDTLSRTDAAVYVSG